MLGDLVDLYRVVIHSLTDKLQVSLATVVFVASQLSLSALVIKQQLENMAIGWMVNLIARQTSRMGCHEFSSKLYQSLQTHVASEHFYFWLNGLKELSQAVLCLSGLEDGDYSAAMAAIAEALRSYQKGIASLTLASLLFPISSDPNRANPGAEQPTAASEVGSTPGLFRKIQSVCLNVSSALQTKTAAIPTPCPSNDYCSCYIQYTLMG